VKSSAVALDVRHLVLLGDGRDRLGEAGAVRAEEELDAVLVDEALGQLRAARRRGFVVVVDNLELVRLAAHLHASHLVEALDGEVVAVLRVLAVHRVLAGERDRRPQVDGVALGLRGGARRPVQKQERR